MRIRFVDEARAEALDAASYYETAQAGLGRRFQTELRRCIESLRENPYLYRRRPGDYHRINMRVFPYYVPYVIRGEDLWLLAVAHSKRRPMYWIDRPIPRP